MAIAYLGLGTNIGDKRLNLSSAIAIIEEKIGEVLAVSSFYETKPWGFESENMFLNAAIKVCTRLSPKELLVATQDIESCLGRKSKSVAGYEDRTIDIDILLYDDLVYESNELTIPHPLMHERDFVMKPMAEIAPELEHPTLKENMKTLKERL
jgi:2-amino-4-hydroxy-6-hydroxymethyldihydropteridine diphosphokinase